MAKRDFQDYICRTFCCFFREGVKEAQACQGALVVERLMLRRLLDPAALPGPEAKQSPLWEEEDPQLAAVVCSRCPFREADCDYRAAVRPAGSEPCGGYILLRLLRLNGTFPAENLAEVAYDDD